MFAPLRSVMAMQQSHCDMGSHIVGESAENSAVISDHTGSHDMMAMSMATSSSEQNSHNCCSDKSICTNNCDMSRCQISMSVSLLMQESSYIPVFTNISGPVAFDTDLIEREFPPPFRPPLVFHS